MVHVIVHVSSMVCVLTFVSKPLDLSIKIECSCHE
jgi:hypothetical protein